MADRVMRFEDLEAWQKARELNAAFADAFSSNPRLAKAWGLRDQIERAAVSIMATIAEGFDRSGAPEFAHGLSIAKGSCAEVRSHLYAALDMRYLDQETFDCLLDLSLQTTRLVAALRNAVLRSANRGR
ncbi:MAG TPA: four helix bundle protein [Tepidiformaceae bacterium]|nr:four helix bundle protein [Tepidiformaceae bacterium]